MTVSEDCKLVNDWLREPDHAEKFTFNNLNDWLDRRPVAEVARLTAALSDQVVVPGGWQDISTAPKDKNVLVVDRGEVSEAYYNGETDTWWLANTAEHDFDVASAIYPTHWQPLPAAPPASTAGEVK